MDITSIPFADSDETVKQFTQKSLLSERRKISLNLEFDNVLKINENLLSNDQEVKESSPTHFHCVVSNGKHNLRRNSISLPTGLNELDLEVLERLHVNNECESNKTSIPYKCNGRITDDDSEEEESEPLYRPKFRSKRKLSIAPLPALKLNDKEIMANDFDNNSVLSNQNSITSINSLASLLKEKMQAFPSMIRKKKKETKDYKIKIFVIMLFLIIVFLVGYAYVMYHQKVLTRSYFEKAKFNKYEKIVTFFNEKNERILMGNLGISVLGEKPFRCLSDYSMNDGSVCLEWNGYARLYMSFDNHNIFHCYTIKWESLEENIFPTDCYDFLKREGVWFGGGLTKNIDWPFNTANFPLSPLITGDAKIHQFGNALKRYFISSSATAIIIDDDTPLYISMNGTSEKFCMQAKNDDFAFVNHITQLPQLNYKVCTANDMRSLHRLLTQQSLWDGLKEDDIKIIHSLLEEPVWQVTTEGQEYLNEATIYNYSESVIAMGFMKLGHIFVNEFWQKNIGDFTLDTERFPSLKSIVNILHRRGFRIVLNIQPFISTDSTNFKDAVNKKLLIYERNSQRSIPALTRYKSLTSAGVLDITNNASIPWLVEKLKAIKDEYQIDGFSLDFGVSYNLPYYYQCHKILQNPDLYARMFAAGLDDHIDYISVSSATTVPRPPAFLSLPPVNSSWEGLQSIAITILNYGVLGYPFFLPGPVGGDYYLPQNFTKILTFYQPKPTPIPSQELYIRWLQLASFLPSIQFSHLPSQYKSDYVTDITKELTTIRQKSVIPLLKKYLSEAMNEGLPLIRPLWMLDPHDPACLSVSDEFSIGEELIVAPILYKGHVTREVYLPQGVWKDGIDGSLRKGSRWIHSYRIPLEKVAYFVKMPDNTRF